MSSGHQSSSSDDPCESKDCRRASKAETCWLSNKASAAAAAVVVVVMLPNFLVLQRSDGSISSQDKTLAVERPLRGRLGCRRNKEWMWRVHDFHEKKLQGARNGGIHVRNESGGWKPWRGRLNSWVLLCSSWSSSRCIIMVDHHHRGRHVFSWSHLSPHDDVLCVVNSSSPL
jgi:hypothetical protein